MPVARQFPRFVLTVFCPKIFYFYLKHFNNKKSYYLQFTFSSFQMSNDRTKPVFYIFFRIALIFKMSVSFFAKNDD